MKDSNVLITGGAGFIGSNLCEALVVNNRVTALDNLSNVDERYIRKFMGNANFRFIRSDLAKDKIPGKPGDFDLVFHLAANSDVKHGAQNTRTDFDNNVLATFNLLEYCRKNDIQNLIFASSSTVYGEASVIPTPENYGPYLPISSYGASKMACEGFISAYSHYYGIKGTIFRFANIVGKNSTHGVIHDFIHKLIENPRELEILGDGTQRKSYLHVSDCVNSMIFVYEKTKGTDIFNLGNSGTTSVVKIADTVVSRMGLKDVSYRFTGGVDGRGWKGDVKIAQLDIAKLTSLGWKNRFNSDQAVEVSVDETLAQIGWEK
ncbi:MAG: NAD-dependent epimerase/dehydratase family protein [Thermoplasmataceae archaeon]